MHGLSVKRDGQTHGRSWRGATAAVLFLRIVTASCAITYERANSLFRVDREGGESKRVTEECLRAIGDQDITEAMERAKYNPYEPSTVRSKPQRRRGYRS